MHMALLEGGKRATSQATLLECERDGDIQHGEGDTASTALHFRVFCHHHARRGEIARAAGTLARRGRPKAGAAVKQASSPRLLLGVPPSFNLQDWTRLACLKRNSAVSPESAGGCEESKWVPTFCGRIPAQRRRV